jgi:hypothetical protein
MSIPDNACTSVTLAPLDRVIADELSMPAGGAGDIITPRTCGPQILHSADCCGFSERSEKSCEIRYRVAATAILGGLHHEYRVEKAA